MSYSKDWHLILDAIKTLSDSNTTLWYRGQSNSSFKLNSGLFRENHDVLSGYLSSEFAKYFNFLQQGHFYHNEKGWNLLFIMQHYGVRTRLLDWSESLVTALFFAFINWEVEKGDSATLWILDPIKMNHLFRGNSSLVMTSMLNDYERYFDPASPFPFNSLALTPPRNSTRMVTQRGVFTLQGNSMNPLEEESNSVLQQNNILFRIDLSPSLYSDVRAFLLQAGVNYFSLFPDLEGLAKSVNNPVLVRDFIMLKTLENIKNEEKIQEIQQNVLSE